LPSLLQDIFGQGEDEEMMDRTRQAQQMMRMLGMKQPYQSPYAGKADSSLIQLILGRLGKMGDWGYPEGMGMDMSFMEDLAEGVQRGSMGRRIKL